MMDVPWNNELYNPEKGNRFEAVYDDGYAVYDNETRLLYHTENEDVSFRLTELMNEQQNIINILLECLYVAEDTVINEYSSHIAADIEKLEKIFKDRDIGEIRKFVLGVDEDE